MIASMYLFSGQASWFQPDAMYGSAHVCASNYQHGKPMDIFIVNDENGNTARCRVIGTGPFYGGRVLDVSPSVARVLGFYDHGTARVRVYRFIHLPGAQHPDCRRRICGVFCEVTHEIPRIPRARTSVLGKPPKQPARADFFSGGKRRYHCVAPHARSRQVRRVR
jgi:hypothetical protein